MILSFSIIYLTEKNDSENKIRIEHLDLAANLLTTNLTLENNVALSAILKKLTNNHADLFIKFPSTNSKNSAFYQWDDNLGNFIALEHLPNHANARQTFFLKPYFIAENKILLTILSTPSQAFVISFIQTNKILVVCALLIILFGMVMLFIHTQKKIAKKFIFTPLATLTETIQQISKTEQFDLQTNLHTQDEMQSLATSLNEMLTIVEKHNQEMTSALEKAERITKREQALLAEAKKSNNSLKIEINIRSKIEKKLINLQSYLNDILDAMSSAIIAINQGFVITQCNAEAAKLAQLESKELIDTHLYTMFPFLKSHIINISKTLIYQQTQRIEKAAVPLYQQLNYFEINIYPLAKSKTPGAVIQITDITHRIRLEELVLQNEKMLSFGRLSSGLAQKVQQPLNNILQSVRQIDRALSISSPTNLEIAKSQQIDISQLQNYLEIQDVFSLLHKIKTLSNQSMNLIATMLRFTQNHYQQFALHDMHIVIDRAIELASHAFDEQTGFCFNNIHIHKQYDPKLCMVPCNINDIQQVFINLLLHASLSIKTNHQQLTDGLISIATRKTEQFAEIVISANGQVISEHDIKKIFDPFYAPSSIPFPAGLELAIAYFIITSQHKGMMSVSSYENTGTSFLVQIPLQYNQLDQDITPREAIEKSSYLAIDEIS